MWLRGQVRGQLLQALTDPNKSAFPLVSSYFVPSLGQRLTSEFEYSCDLKSGSSLVICPALPSFAPFCAAVILARTLEASSYSHLNPLHQHQAQPAQWGFMLSDVS